MMKEASKKKGFGRNAINQSSAINELRNAKKKDIANQTRESTYD